MTLSFTTLLCGVLVGAALGALYLRLLWVAVRSLPQDRHGARVFMLLGALRMALLIGALIVAAALDVPAQGIAASLLGFIVMRVTATRWLAHTAPKDRVWK